MNRTQLVVMLAGGISRGEITREFADHLIDRLHPPMVWSVTWTCGCVGRRELNEGPPFTSCRTHGAHVSECEQVAA